MRFLPRAIIATKSCRLGSITLDIPLGSVPNLWLEDSVFTHMSGNRGSSHAKYHVFEDGSCRGNSRNDRLELHGSSKSNKWTRGASLLIYGRSIRVTIYFLFFFYLATHTHQILRVMFMLNEGGGALLLLVGSSSGRSGKGVELVARLLLTGRR